jgi:Family of unknown function (DUF6788)
MAESTTALLRRRALLVQRLAPLVSFIVRGSLIERFVRCGKPGCHCAHGPGHGPKYYLSVSYPGGRPELQYVSQEQQPQVQGLLKNFQQVRALLEEICQLNRELLRRQEPF